MKAGNLKEIQKQLNKIEIAIYLLIERLDELIYPPENTFRKDFIKEVKKAEKRKFKKYNTVEDFFREIER